MTREDLGINDWLELIKEDKNLNGAYISIEQYIYLIEKENKELKSQLKGTTHCFDEEEHLKLKEEIINLSKDVDMWNSKYNDMFDKNKELKQKYLNAVTDCDTTMFEKEQLKKQLEETEKCLKDMYRINIENDKELENVKTQQKEFITYLEDEIQKKRRKATTLTSFTRNVVPLKHCLQKYKEIIGDDK